MRMVALLACLLLSACAMPRWGNKEWTIKRDYKNDEVHAFGPPDTKIRVKYRDGMEVEVDGTGRPSILEQAVLGAVMTGVPRDMAISSAVK